MTAPGPVIVPVVSQTMATVGQLEVPAGVLGGPVREALLHEMVKSQLAARRSGTHATKTRAPSCRRSAFGHESDS